MVVTTVLCVLMEMLRHIYIVVLMRFAEETFPPKNCQGAKAGWNICLKCLCLRGLIMIETLIYKCIENIQRHLT